MARGGGSGRWIAASGGVLINGLILAALVLVEEPAPRLEEPPVIMLDLERPQKHRVPRRRTSMERATRLASAASTAETSPVSPASVVGGEAAANAEPSPAIDPAWRINRKAVDQWRLIEGAPEAGWGRFYRACKGLSSEHMTPDEKERCYGGWAGKSDKRPSPGFVGPIDERKWETHSPSPEPSRYDKDVQRQDRCRDYRRGRTPNFSERNLVTGSPPPSLRERGCF